jgi:hypothetical protein
MQAGQRCWLLRFLLASNSSTRLMLAAQHAPPAQHAPQPSPHLHTVVAELPRVVPAQVAHAAVRLAQRQHLPVRRHAAQPLQQQAQVGERERARQAAQVAGAAGAHQQQAAQPSPQRAALRAALRRGATARDTPGAGVSTSTMSPDAAASQPATRHTATGPAAAPPCTTRTTTRTTHLTAPYLASRGFRRGCCACAAARPSGSSISASWAMMFCARGAKGGRRGTRGRS